MEGITRLGLLTNTACAWVEGHTHSIPKISLARSSCPPPTTIDPLFILDSPFLLAFIPIYSPTSALNALTAKSCSKTRHRHP